MISNMYAVGLFDGEGCVGVYVNGRTLSMTLSVANTDKKLLDAMHEAFGGTVREMPKRKGKKHWSTVWCWQVHGAEAESFAKRIFKHTISKREQLAIFVELRATCDRKVNNRWHPHTSEMLDYRQSLVDEIKTLKKVPTDE